MKQISSLLAGGLIISWPQLTIRFAAIILLSLCGCAGGPTKDYYNPAVVGAKFQEPITMALVEDLKAEKEKCVRDGYTVIGTTDYSGKVPEAVELLAQAKRVHANHVIYSCRFIPAPPGSWSFGFGNGFGAGGSGGGRNDVHIVFLGR